MKIALREYARNNRRWEGRIPTSNFERVASEFTDFASSVLVNIEFSLDENNRIKVSGEATLEAKVTCHRCSVPVGTTIVAEMDATIVRSEDDAREFAQQGDVILVNDTSVSVVELIEDDLMMSVPWRVCEQGDNCVNLHASEKSAKSADADGFLKHQPFKNLRDLLKS